MQQHIKPIFYGLLYVEEVQTKQANITGGGDSLDIYLRCAGLCARSVAFHGYSFRLVTNVKTRIDRRLRDLGLTQIDVLEHEFALSVPTGIPFRAAHFKLELYRLLGSSRFGNYVGVIDIDSVMNGPINFPLLPPGALLVYDITDQVVQEYGSDTVRSDLERVSGTHVPEIRWLGGEFIFGHAESFQLLAASIFRLWPRYIQSIGTLHHVGDEMVVSAAIFSADVELIDGGRLGFVVRWWTARTNFKQMTFDAAAPRSILHLPSDKQFLAGYVCNQYRPQEFIAAFRRAARGKLLRRRVYNLVEGLLCRKRKYVAHLS